MFVCVFDKCFTLHLSLVTRALSPHTVDIQSCTYRPLLSTSSKLFTITHLPPLLQKTKTFEPRRFRSGGLLFSHFMLSLTCKLVRNYAILGSSVVFKAQNSWRDGPVFVLFPFLFLSLFFFLLSICGDGRTKFSVHFDCVVFLV